MKFFVVVSYDIKDDRRRNKLSKELLNYGKRVQFSVFECNLTQIEINDMEKRIKKIVNVEEDSVKIYILDMASKLRSKSIGTKRFTEDEDYLIF